jgi:hypothetical protein
MLRITLELAECPHMIFEEDGEIRCGDDRTEEYCMISPGEEENLWDCVDCNEFNSIALEIFPTKVEQIQKGEPNGESKW